MYTSAHAASTPPLLGNRPNQRSKAGFVKLMAAWGGREERRERGMEEKEGKRQTATAEAEWHNMPFVFCFFKQAELPHTHTHTHTMWA